MKRFFKQPVVSCLSAVLSSILLAIMMPSCKKSPLTNGKVITETRKLDAFDTLYIYDNIDVTLICSDSYKIEITTGENLMPNIISESNGESLILRNDNICNWLRSYDCPLEARIYYDSKISSILYESVGDLSTETYISNDTLPRFDITIEDGSGDISININCKKFHLTSHSGTNKINIEGSSVHTFINHNGLGPVDGLHFPSRDTEVRSHSSNNIHVNCSANLNASIYDRGNIYYKGHPAIKSYISPNALGRIIEIEN